MVICQQFIFTAANVKNKTGYQVTARSSNITPKLLSDLEDYMYPIGVDPNKFLNSESLLILDDKVAYTTVKNIGLGYDGRYNNLFSHTIIINIDDFIKFDNDTRCLEKLSDVDVTSTHLPPISIKPFNNEPNFDCIDIIGISQFEYFFRCVLDKKKIVILDIIENNIIKNLLSLLPPSYRLISFSTLVIKEHRQPNFNIIQADKTTSLPKNYHIIITKNITKNFKNKNTLFDHAITYMMEIINSKNTIHISNIHDNFEKISFLNDKNKLILAIMISVPTPKNMYDIDHTLEEFLSILEKIPSDFMIKYFKKIEILLPINMVDKYRNKIISEHELLNFNNNSTYNDMSNIFDKLTNDTSRLSFLREIISNNLQYMIKSGSKIFIDSIGTRYNYLIIYGFLENKDLHACVIDVLIKLNYNDRKKHLLNNILDESLNGNTFPLEKLFDPNIFNLNNNPELLCYHDLIGKLFTSYLFYEKTNSKIITNIIKKIYDNLLNEFVMNGKIFLSGPEKPYVVLNMFHAVFNITHYLLFERKLNTKELNEIQSSFEQLTRLSNNNTKYQLKDIFNPIRPIFIKYFFPSFHTDK